MNGLTFCLMLQAAVMGADGEPKTYDDAFREAESKNQPLVVLVGTDWCPGCVTMKQGVIPRLLSRGKFRRVSLAQVNSDEQAELAGKLMKGSSIPQLIVFTKTAEGWQREQITGPAADEDVEALIQRAVDTQLVAKTASAGGGKKVE